jgi:hypothetical protein
MATTGNMAREIAIEMVRLGFLDKSRDEMDAEMFRIFPTATPEDYKLAFVKVQQFVQELEWVRKKPH